MSILDDVGWGVCHLVAKVVIGIAKCPNLWISHMSCSK
jgi:hypothetical protein